MGRLAGKVAVVTGAGSSGPGVGTGKAISVLFAREGAKVLLVDQVAERAEETREMIAGEGGEASVFAADVTKSADCRAMAEAAVARYGGLHILVNNVGILGKGTVVTVDEDEWDRVLAVNLKSMVLTSKHAVPVMAAGGGGSIINISSIAALRSIGVTGTVPYSVSKGGAIALTTSMAVQHGRQNVRVNCITPGFLYTPMVAGTMTPEARELRRKASPLGTEGTAWDVAWACVYLASDEARWVTGAALPVDGGALCTTALSAFHDLR
jgi:NAD(P)-dependent dehydrogenase (short-subunit alcohol dehydrogenase family)